MYLLGSLGLCHRDFGGPGVFFAQRGPWLVFIGNVGPRSQEADFIWLFRRNSLLVFDPLVVALQADRGHTEFFDISSTRSSGSATDSCSSVFVWHAWEATPRSSTSPATAL